MTESTEAQQYRAESAAAGRPRPLGSLLASAKRLTGKTMSRAGSTAKSWQEDAWEMYDLVGEQRFLAATLAGRMSQARLYVGQIDPDEPTETPEAAESPEVQAVLNAFGASAATRQQILNRLSINLFVAGDGWIAGIPKTMIPESLKIGPVNDDAEPAGPQFVDPSQVNDGSDLSIDDLDWRMLSVSEVSSNAGGQVTLTLGETEAEKIVCDPDEIFLIRVWRPHPRRWWEADSPTRSSLPVLRELVGLTMHISAQVDSRLAGAGLLIVPQSAQRALQRAAGLADDDETDQFTEALMEAMLTPIQDRGNASALVPLVVTVPDEVTAMFQFITFAKPLDSEARSLRDEAIRRLALGQDAPPELLLGTSGMNHWGAWLVREDVVTTHLEPPLALICDALTTQYLWPVLIDQGMEPSEARKYVVWYDVSHMVVRPNLSTDAMELHQRGAISDEALRTSTGFDESDAPMADVELPVEVKMALELVRSAPGLIGNPGLPAVVAQIKAAIEGAAVPYTDPVAPAAEPDVAESPVPAGDGPTAPGAPDGGIPQTSGEPAELPGMAAALHPSPIRTTGRLLIGVNGGQ